MQVNEVVAIDTLIDDNPEVASRITGLARLTSAVLPNYRISFCALHCHCNQIHENSICNNT
jgi:hypothetical protein